MSPHPFPLLLIVAAALSLEPSTSRAKPELWEGQRASSPRVGHLTARWFGTWETADGVATIEVEAQLLHGSELQLALGGRSYNHLYLFENPPRSVSAGNRVTSCAFHIELTKDEACGSVSRQAMGSESSPSPCEPSTSTATYVHFEPLDRVDGRHDFDGTPRCGKRMVEILESRGNERTVTCVDRAYEGADSLSILEIGLDPQGHPLWLMSPAPWGGEPYDTERTAAVDLAWDVPETCFPWFPPRPSQPWPPVQAARNSAIVFDWAEDHDLVSLQVWQDDHETGSFVILHADGKPATLGYRIDGEAHGVWYYFDRDANLVEARLFALGVFLTTIPIAEANTP